MPSEHGPEPTALALVVDDEPFVREYVERLLRRVGLEVVTAGDGAEALALLDRLRVVPRVIVTDLGMPVLDGVRLLEELRRRPALARVPVVVVSGSEHACAPPDLCLVKPFDSGELLRAVAATGALHDRAPSHLLRARRTA